MRLSIKTKELIIISIEPFLEEMPAELRLYGSRVNDDLRGGDIDLLLIASSTDQHAKLLNNKYNLLVSIKKNIGDQKIDLTIVTKDMLQTDAFTQLIYGQSIVLKEMTSPGQ